MFNLPQGTDSMESHLCLIYLSKESVTEGELIFARARLFDLEDSVRARCGSVQSEISACRYPTHPGSDSKGVKTRYSVNLQMSKAISKMYGVL